MYTLLIYFLISSFIILIFLGRFIGKNYSIIFALTSILLSTLISYFIFYEVVILHVPCTILLSYWINIDLVNVCFELNFDSLSSVMLVVILTVSSCVHIFSVEYMGDDPHFIRFLSYLTLFTIFMIIFVLSSNFIQLFFGWEGVGLSSYLLINFWFNRAEANRSAIKAVIFNRFGDFGLYFALILIFFIFKTLNIFSVFNIVFYIYNFNFYILFFDTFNILTVISILLFLAASGKSAQLGLHVWLPDAMEGPTPVSALIHAATMVTAGVFLLIRMSPLIEYSSTALVVVMFFGGLTTFFSSTIGVVQNDIKKVIAYSTCSQLGYMVFACGSSNYSASLFHLFNHAFFKALLFLGAGAVIHSMLDEQDLRKYGGLIKIVPFSYISLFIGSAALAGFPFLSGFYSKDFIIEGSFALFSLNGFFIYWLGTFSVFFTAFYSYRLLYLTFFAKSNSSKIVIEKVHESGSFITISLSILILFSIFSGYIFFDLFIGFGSNTFSDSIYFNPKNNYTSLAEFLPKHIKLLPLFFSFFGFFFSFLFFKFNFVFVHYMFKIKYFNLFYSILSKKWYFDLIYFNLVIKKCLNYFFNVFFKILDRGLLELFGPTGLVRIIKKLSLEVHLKQKGHITFYIFSILYFFLLLILFYFLNFSYIFIFLILVFFILKPTQYDK